MDVNTEELKNETKETFDRVKSEIKDANFKEETKQATNFVKEMIFNPIEAVKRVARDDGPSLITLIMIVALIAILNAIKGVVSETVGALTMSIGEGLIKIILEIMFSLLYFVFLSVMIFILNTGNKKSLISIISTMVVANIPLIFINIFAIIGMFVQNLVVLTDPIQICLIAVQSILMFFGVKEIFEEDEEGLIFKFALTILFTSLFIIVLAKIFA